MLKKTEIEPQIALTVRLSRKTRKLLKAKAVEVEKPMTAIVEKLIKQFVGEEKKVK
jgi:hypothetical protein